MRRTFTFLAATMIVFGCSTPAATPSAPPVPPASARASAAAVTQTPTATQDIEPSAVPAKKLVIRWAADDPVGLGTVAEMVGMERAGDSFVLVTQTYGEDETVSRAWWSGDGRSWELAQTFPEGQRILTVAASGPGFVLGGFDDGNGIIWTSTDGRAWQAVSDASLRNGVIGTLVPTASGLVGFGWRSDRSGDAIWTSPDGFEWLAATNETGNVVARGLQAVGSYDGRAIAFVSEGDRKPPAIWETTGRGEWKRTGTLAGARVVEVVVGGPRGWVALSPNDAWASADGRSWSKRFDGPDVASDVIADDAGFVAVGYVGSLPGETCGDQRPFAGHTWTSADGRAWQKMPVTDEFKKAMVLRLFVVDRTLIGYGGRIGDLDGSGIGDADGFTIGRWTASLPDFSRPAGASDKASVMKGCGG